MASIYDNPDVFAKQIMGSNQPQDTPVVQTTTRASIYDTPDIFAQKVRASSTISPTITQKPVTQPVSSIFDPIGSFVKNVGSQITNLSTKATQSISIPGIKDPITINLLAPFSDPVETFQQNVKTQIEMGSNIIDAVFKAPDRAIDWGQKALVDFASKPENTKVVDTLMKAEPLYNFQMSVFDNNPYTRGVIRGMNSQYLGSSKKVMDTFNTPIDHPKDVPGKIASTVGEVVGNVAGFMAGGEILKAAGFTKAYLPLLMGITGQTSSPYTTTVKQRLEKIAPDLIAGWLTSVVGKGFKREVGNTLKTVAGETAKVAETAKQSVLTSMKEAGATGSIFAAQQFINSLIDGLSPKEAAEISGRMFVVGALFHVGAAAIGLADTKLSQPKGKIASIDLTPQEARNQVIDTPLSKQQIGKDILKASIQAEAEGKNIRIIAGEAKNTTYAKVKASIPGAEQLKPDVSGLRVEIVEPMVAKPQVLPGAKETQPQTPEQTGIVPNQPQKPVTTMPVEVPKVTETIQPSTQKSPVLVKPDIGTRVYPNAGKVTKIVDQEQIKAYSDKVTVPTENTNDLEVKTMQALKDDPASFINGYIDTFGTDINPDHIRMLFDGYTQQNADKFKKPTNILTDMLRDYMIKTRKAEGFDTVLVTAGGPGSGKSTAVEEYVDHPEDYAFVFDSTLSSQNAVDHIKKLRNKGMKVDLMFVSRDLPDAWENGVMKRKRVVTEGYFVHAHQQAINNLTAIYDKFKDDPDVSIQIMKSTGDGFTDLTIDDIKKYTIEKEKVARQIGEVTKRAYEQGLTHGRKLTKAEYEAYTADTRADKEVQGSVQERPQAESRTPGERTTLNKVSQEAVTEIQHAIASGDLEAAQALYNDFQQDKEISLPSYDSIIDEITKYQEKAVNEAIQDIKEVGEIGGEDSPNARLLAIADKMAAHFKAPGALWKITGRERVYKTNEGDLLVGGDAVSAFDKLIYATDFDGFRTNIRKLSAKFDHTFSEISTIIKGGDVDDADYEKFKQRFTELIAQRPAYRRGNSSTVQTRPTEGKQKDTGNSDKVTVDSKVVDTEKLSKALRNGEIDKNGAYFSLPGNSTYHDESNPDIKRYDLSKLKIVDTSDKKTAVSLLEKALQDTSNTPDDIKRIKDAISNDGFIDYMLNDEVPSVVKAAKAMGYDGIAVAENDDLPGDATSVFAWKVEGLKGKLDPMREDRLINSLQEAETMLRANRDVAGRRMTTEYRKSVERSAESTRRKLGIDTTTINAQAEILKKYIGDIFSIVTPVGKTPQGKSTSFYITMNRPNIGYTKWFKMKNFIESVKEAGNNTYEIQLKVDKKVSANVSDKTPSVRVPEKVDLMEDDPTFGHEPTAQNVSYTSNASMDDFADVPLLTRQSGNNGKGPHGPYETKIIEFPEIVQLARELMGKYPIVKSPRERPSLGGKPAGWFQMSDKGEVIGLNPEIFKDVRQAASTLAHEIGHLTDFMPEGTLRRGNILGRVASLRNYIEMYLQEYPGSPQDIITPATLKDLETQARNKANMQKQSEGVTAEDVLAIWQSVEVKDKGLETYIAKLDTAQKKEIVKAALKGKVPEWVSYKEQPQNIKDIFDQLVKEEIIKRKLYEKKEVMKELRSLSVFWKPLNPELASSPQYRAYRFSSKELYADAISVLLNDPDRLVEMAPNFNKAFFEYINRKPEFRDEYFKIVDTINQPDNQIDVDRLDRMYDGFKEARAKRLEIENKPVKKYSWLESVMRQHVTKFDPIYRKMKDGRELGITTSPLAKMRMNLEEMQMRRNDSYLYLEAVNKDVMMPLKEIGLSEDDLGVILTLERNLGDRKAIANPYGLNGQYAQSTLDFFKEHLKKTKGITDEQTRVLEQVARKFRDMTFELNVKAARSGFYSKQFLNETVLPNKDSYVTYQINDYISTNFVSAAVKKAVGTLKEHENPFVSTVMKNISIIEATKAQEAKTGLVSEMKENFSTDIIPSEPKQVEGVRVGWKPREDMEALELHEDGKAVAYDVDPYIKRMFDFYTPTEIHNIVKVSGAFNKVFKPLVTTYNVSWGFYSNITRDAKRTYRNLATILPTVGNKKKLTVSEFITTWLSSIPKSLEYQKGQLSDLTRQMLEYKAFSTSFTSFDPTLSEDTGLAPMLRKYHLLPEQDKNNYIKKVLTPLRKILKGIEFAGSVFEVNTKIAGYQIISKRVDNARELGFITRNYVGTPNFLDGGSQKEVDNNIFVFSNIMVQALRSDTELATHPKTRAGYWYNTFMMSMLPKILMLLASAGYFGSKLKDIMDKQSEYDKTNYIVIPIAQTSNGKSVVFRSPEDETSRLFGAVVWKVGMAMQGKLQKIEQLASLGAGFIPSVTPIWDIAAGWIQYTQGRNPYDSYRGRLVIDDTTWKAGGWPALQKMVQWTTNEAGLSQFSSYDAGRNSTFDTIMQNTWIINRMFKVSDYGLTEQEKSVQTAIESENARKTLKERELLQGYVDKAKQNPKDYTNLQLEFVRSVLGEPPYQGDDRTKLTNLKKKFQINAVKGTLTREVDTMISTNSNDVKMKLMEQYKQRMTDQEYKDLRQTIIQYGIVSKQFVKELNQKKL
jgi:hypothetical protein